MNARSLSRATKGLLVALPIAGLWVIFGADLCQGQPQQTEVDSSASAHSRPTPPAAAERIDERGKMVTQQIESSLLGRRPIKNAAVLAAMRNVPRHAFVPRELARQAYHDGPLPIGYGQTISQSYMVALMTNYLKLTPQSKVLEIGTGSGYQAAVLAELTPHTYTVEIIKPLAERAKKTLKDQGYTEIEFLRADGYHGWKEKGPFDAIIVTCAAGHLPPPLWEQLKPGGCILIPIGSPYAIQRLVKLTKTKEGKRRSKSLGAVRFVPLTRGKR